MIRKLTASLLLFSLMLLAGCGGGSALNNLTGGGKEAETERWNSYVAVSNDINKLNKALDNYLETFGAEDEFHKNQKTTNFLNSLTGGPGQDRFTKAIDKAIELSAKGSADLDKAAAKMLVPLKELWETLQQASSYYRNKDYVDDNYAKAQTLHAKIITTYPAFDDAIADFNNLMDQQAREIRKSEIKEMKSNGLVIKAAMLNAVDAAKNMQDVLYSQQITSQNLLELNMDDFKPVYDEYVKALDAYEKVSQDEKQIKKEKLSYYSAKNVLNGLKQVKASASGLIERYQQKKAGPRSAPKMTAGTPEHLDQQMSTLVTRYNQAIGAR